MNNGGHTKQFDALWNVTEKKWITSGDICKWQTPYSKHQRGWRCCYQYD